jgi:hypothetical protein
MVDRTPYCIEGCGRPAETSRLLAMTEDGIPITELVCFPCYWKTPIPEREETPRL